MTIRRTLATAAALSALTAGAIAPVAGAAGNAPKLELEGAYAYVDTIAASKQKFVRVVFKTSGDLARRFDGMIQAGVSIDGVSHSIGSAKRGTRCYAGASEIKGGSIATLVDGEVVRKGAKLGRTFTIKVADRAGHSVTKKLKLRAERPGDDSGRPLGC